jgi:hypothetical protein
MQMRAIMQTWHMCMQEIVTYRPQCQAHIAQGFS